MQLSAFDSLKSSEPTEELHNSRHRTSRLSRAQRTEAASVTQGKASGRHRRSGCGKRRHQKPPWHKATTATGIRVRPRWHKKAARMVVGWDEFCWYWWDCQHVSLARYWTGNRHWLDEIWPLASTVQIPGTLSAQIHEPSKSNAPTDQILSWVTRQSCGRDNTLAAADWPLFQRKELHEHPERPV